MNFSFVRFTLALMVTQQVSSLPLACSYNETLYKEGESVATEEPCLSCVCRRGALACSLRVCAGPLGPLPPGCFLVHRPGDCCPQLLCEEGFNQDGIELRTGVKAEKKLVENGCFVNGTVYAEGSAVGGSALGGSQPCEYCYCIQGEVRCIRPQCAHPFHDCTPIYEPSSCCPTQFDCRKVAVDTPTTSSTLGCETEGVRYSEGELVSSSNSSKCESCYCVEGKVKCAPIECPTGVFDNCQPLRSPDQCCPTSFSCGKSHLKTGNDSVRSMTTPKPHMETLKPNEEESTVEPATDAYPGNATTEETRTEGSTTTWEMETTTTALVLPKVEAAENSTTFGFQVIKFQNESNDLTVAVTEETTSEPEATSSPELLDLDEHVFDVEIQTKLDFADQRAVFQDFDGIISNSSHEFHDDYDSYDYSEPKLPPSLPNLVIFPFVAADAVVKGDNTSKLDTFESNSVKRIDNQKVFYRDYFSPPVRTEGGFVPKEPELPSEPFYDDDFYKKEENPSEVKEHKKIIGQLPPKPEKCYSEGRELEHGELLSEAGDCVSCVCLEGSIVCQDIDCPKLEPGCKKLEDKSSSCCGKILCEPEFPREETQAPKVVATGPEAVALEPETSGTGPSDQEPTPDLLLTSDTTAFLLTRETKPVTVAYKNVIVDYYPDYLVTRNNFRTKNVGKKPTREPSKASAPANDTAGFPSALAEAASTLATALPTTSESSFFDEFFKNFLSDDTRSTTRTVPKYKYSSKIKSQATTTARPNAEDVTRDPRPPPSSSSYSFLDFLLDPATSPRAKAPNDPAPPTHDPNLTSFLKLAGCNIYGRMYRVGKIIIELSGPCLECVCTDFGVQCKPLIC